MIEQGFMIGLGIVGAFVVICIASVGFIGLMLFVDMTAHNRKAKRLQAQWAKDGGQLNYGETGRARAR